ncbi:hypothetical protein QFZ30_002109 [Arthrobacter pascens]|nr:hypothetical protein [Arthrobacter pascens]
MPGDARPIASAGVTSSAELIAAYFRQHGTLPKISASPVGEEGQKVSCIDAWPGSAYSSGKGNWNRPSPQYSTRIVPDGQMVMALAVTGFGSDRIWQDRRDALIAWMDAQGRPPHYASGDSAERALASWVATYRRHALHGRHLERIKELDERVPGWSQSVVWVPKA